MFAIRSCTIEDLEDLYELSQTVTFINLPANKETIEKKIKTSIKSFDEPSDKLDENTYLFVLEDLEKSKVIGVSMIHAQHGTEDEPHFYLSVGQEHKFSKTLNTGFIHGTLKLGLDTDGPTEIGGLVLSEHYRGNGEKLGKQLSFCRFLYMSIFPDRFKKSIHSELMPPLDKDGNSPLWEAIGRRFLNLDYQEADILSRKNKEFILSLFPSGVIYETLLPIEARNSIGEVGENTRPVKKMLESIGFKYVNEVDPFDGGPHYRSELSSIKPIRESISGVFNSSLEYNENSARKVLVTLENTKYDFFCAQIKVNIKNDEENINIIASPEDVQKYKIKAGSKAHLINI